MDNKLDLREILDWALHIVIAIAVALLIVNLLGQPTIVRGSSMEPTLQNGNVLIIEKLTQRFGDIKQGDIVVLNIPEFLDRNKTYAIKRVIAKENQKVLFKDNKVFVDGAELDEDYINGNLTLPLNSQYESVTVPDGCIYVLGDNRGASRDSRVFGPVSVKKISGKAFFRLYPFSELGMLE